MLGRSTSSSLGQTFNRLWAASIAGNLADGLVYTAGPLLAVTLTRNPVLIAMFSSLGSVPWLLFAIPIGGIADRIDRGVALAVANLARVGLVLLIAAAIVFQWMSIPLLFAVTFGIGITEVFVDTTSQAVLPMLLEPDQFERGNARLYLAESVVQSFVGAPLGGFLFAAAMALPFVAGLAGYLLAAGFILAIALQRHRPLRAQRGPREQHFRAELREGLAFLRDHRPLRHIVIFTTSAYLLFSLSGSTQALFLLDELGVPKAWFGAVLTVAGLGNIAGSAVAPRVAARFPRGRVMTVAMAYCGFGMVLQGLAPNIWVFLALQITGAFAMAQWNILLISWYQLVIPVEMFGRVHGARRTFVWGMGPLGAIVGGWLATTGLRTPIVVGGAAILALTLLNARRLATLGSATPEAA